MFTSPFRPALRLWAPAGLIIFCVTLAPLAWCESSFTLFESGQVRPLALAPSGKYLYAVNTPDNRIEVFRISKRGLRHVDSVPVGIEPVAVAARSERRCGWSITSPTA
jgi:hypothetical protein